MTNVGKYGFLINDKPSWSHEVLIDESTEYQKIAIKNVQWGSGQRGGFTVMKLSQGQAQCLVQCLQKAIDMTPPVEATEERPAVVVKMEGE